MIIILTFPTRDDGIVRDSWQIAASVRTQAVPRAYDVIDLEVATRPSLATIYAEAPKLAVEMYVDTPAVPAGAGMQPIIWSVATVSDFSVPTKLPQLAAARNHQVRSQRAMWRHARASNHRVASCSSRRDLPGGRLMGPVSSSNVGIACSFLCRVHARWRQPSRGLVHDVPRGARPLARIIAPQACIRWTRGDPDHDAAMRIGGEAPGRRAHSSMRHESHRKARVTATSDRHRQPAGEPWAGRETVSGAPLRPSPLTPPDAGRHRPASRRWSPNATAR